MKEARKYIGERASLVKKINGKYRKIRLGADATDAGPSSFARQRSPLEDHPVVVFSLPSAEALAKKTHAGRVKQALKETGHTNSGSEDEDEN